MQVTRSIAMMLLFYVAFFIAAGKGMKTASTSIEQHSGKFTSLEHLDSLKTDGGYKPEPPCDDKYWNDNCECDCKSCKWGSP